jgi:hypothetical protein
MSGFAGMARALLIKHHGIEEPVQAVPEAPVEPESAPIPVPEPEPAPAPEPAPRRLRRKKE